MYITFASTIEYLYHSFTVMEKNSLEGKLVLVTGGGSGIGKECCKLAAKLGGSVIVCDCDETTANETKKELDQSAAKNQKHLAVKCDVSSKQSVDQLSKTIYNVYNKPPSVVIHCAGIVALEKDEIPKELWQQVIDVNLKGTFLIDTTFAKLMKEGGIAGSIVNIASIAKDGIATALSYSTSKAGVCGVTKTIAQEFGPYNIRCNAVAPGVIKTPMGELLPDAMVQKYLGICAMKRNGRPEEIASVCIFLGSDASSYVNGIVMKVHGGRIIC